MTNKEYIFFYIKSKLAKFDYNSFITDILFENVFKKKVNACKTPYIFTHVEFIYLCQRASDCISQNGVVTFHILMLNILLRRVKLDMWWER
jgi:hypothetical protein